MLSYWLLLSVVFLFGFTDGFGSPGRDLIQCDTFCDEKWAIYHFDRLVLPHKKFLTFLAIFAFILIYLFSIVGFLFFQDQCEVEIDLNGESVVENHCETLLMSIITTFNEGLRNGGGIGDFLRHLSKDHDQVKIFESKR